MAKKFFIAVRVDPGKPPWKNIGTVKLLAERMARDQPNTEVIVFESVATCRLTLNPNLEWEDCGEPDSPPKAAAEKYRNPDYRCKLPNSDKECETYRVLVDDLSRNEIEESCRHCYFWNPAEVPF